MLEDVFPIEIVPRKGAETLVSGRVIPTKYPYACFQKYWYPKMDGENKGSKPY